MLTQTLISLLRLVQQRISQDPLVTPHEVVAWLCAVQAQDYLGAKWALGLRMQEPVDRAIEQAYNSGAILRTHVLRPTWHFVTPSDIRWMLQLTGPRVHAANAGIYRRRELDAALFARTDVVIAGALQARGPLTREELGAALAESGIQAEGIRLGYMLMHAELEAIVCSGPRRGRQFTYALLEARAPQARRLSREEALAELTRRYFSGHGPATIHDFAWWSGLTVADAKTGLELVNAYLANEAFDGRFYWFPASMNRTAQPSKAAFLLPTYDEFLVGFANFDQRRRAESDESELYNSMIFLDGHFVGSWRRSLEKGIVSIQLRPFTRFSAVQFEAVAAAAEHYGKFLEMPVEIT